MNISTASKKSRRANKNKNKNTSITNNPIRVNTSKQNNRLISDPSCSLYKKAVLTPFDPSSNGARVPDMYSAPTATLRLTKRFTVSSDASGNIGLLCLPNACINSVCDTGALSGGSLWSAWTGTSINGSGLITCSPANISGRLSSYRIVGWGVKIIDVASMTNVAGVVTVAKVIPSTRGLVPARLSIGGNNIANSTAVLQYWYANMGIPYTGANDSAKIDVAGLSALPEHTVFTGLELAQSGTRVLSKPISPLAFEFQLSQDSTMGDDPAVGVSTTNIFVGDSSYARLSPFEIIVVGGTGFPSSTACLDIEIVYHLEGQPAVQGTSGVSQDGVRSSPSSYSNFLNVLDIVASAASFVPALSPVANTYKSIRAITA